MQAGTYTTAQPQLADTMDEVCRDHEPVIITTETEQAVVLISLDDYSALSETAHLLRTPANTRRLPESVAALERGGGTELGLV